MFPTLCLGPGIVQSPGMIRSLFNAGDSHKLSPDNGMNAKLKILSHVVYEKRTGVRRKKNEENRDGIVSKLVGNPPVGVSA